MWYFFAKFSERGWYFAKVVQINRLCSACEGVADAQVINQIEFRFDTVLLAILNIYILSAFECTKDRVDDLTGAKPIEIADWFTEDFVFLNWIMIRCDAVVIGHCCDCL